ncbi:MAG: hypothetical protein ABI963_14570 [Rhizomicrobium sp.]
MRAMIVARTLAAGVVLIAAAPLPASIGVATMGSNGTISLRLRAQGLSGVFGESVIVYRRDNPQYNEVLRHIGGLKPGQTKPVAPWKN